MQQGTQFRLKCPKCGKTIAAASEEEAKDKLKAHDDEMHEGSYQVACEKRSL
jgi:uncharacterized protein with PIN domain